MPTTTIAIEPGATELDHGSGITSHHWPDGEVGIAHDCRVFGDMQIRCAPRLTDLGKPGGHQILSADPLTVTPSIMCPDCGLHGYITDGMWRDC